MAEKNRIDLDTNWDNIGGSLLDDIKAATEQVKQQKAAEKQKEMKAAQKAKDRKLSGIVIAAAAVVILLIAYFTVFAGPSDTPGPSSNQAITAEQNCDGAKSLKNTCQVPGGQSSSLSSGSTSPSRDSQAVTRPPSDEYMLNDSPGM